jgi:hypothetical protein
LEVAKEELNKMTKAKEEGMGERAEMVRNVGRMKAMEGQMRGSSTFFIFQIVMEVSSVCFLMFQFGKNS